MDRKGPDVWRVDGETMGFRLPSTSTDHPVACFSWWDFGWRPNQIFLGSTSRPQGPWPGRFFATHTSIAATNELAFPHSGGRCHRLCGSPWICYPPLGMKQPKPGYRVVLSVGEIVSCLNRGESCKRP